MPDTPTTSSRLNSDPTATSSFVEDSVLLPSFSGFQSNGESTPVPMPNIDECSAKESETSTFHDLIAGGVAGSASVIVGHPFDTIKVRIQTSSGGSLTSMATSFGGISSLFRGMAAPLVSASAVNALIFSSYGASSRYWEEHFATQRSLKEEEETGHDPWQKSFFCGSFAGLVQCVVICPSEHVKCRLQIQHGAGTAHIIYKGPLQATTSILRSHGISGLFRGWWVTVWREVPAFGLYFSNYDYCKDRVTNFLADHAGLKEEDDVPHSHLWASSALAGGISGCVTWAVIYPFDVIKSRIQTAPMDTALEKRRMWTVGRSLVVQHGWRYMFRGLGITLIRAFPVNGIIFPVYEFTLLHLSGELMNND
jgi:solute carrier family 25 (mitochondrial carnitine/acylcarnitine transporter), member 20/29